MHLILGDIKGGWCKQAAQPSHTETSPALAEYMRELHTRASVRTRIRTTNNKSRHTFHSDFLPPPPFARGRLLIILAPSQRFFLSPSLRYFSLHFPPLFSPAYLLCAPAALFAPSYVHTLYLMLLFALHNPFIYPTVRNSTRAHDHTRRKCVC